MKDVREKRGGVAASPAAPHPGYSISEDRLRYCRSVGSAQYQNDGDIQALLGAVVKRHFLYLFIYNINIIKNFIFILNFF